MEEKTGTIVCVDEVVFDGQTEQGVELDYVLPDYCPDIFKVLSCTLDPAIVSYNASADGRLNIDGVVYIKVLYTAEGSENVQCIDGRYTYSKTVDMNRKNIANPVVSLQMKSDYCSCRAVSPRRIDVRGAVTCRIKASASVEYALPDIPEGLQVRTTEINCCGKTLSAEKQLTIREEIDTGAAGIAFIMQCRAVPKITDLRVIADKAVLKGTVTINALYGVPDAENDENIEKWGAADTEKMTADIPISAILDIDGITSAHRTFPEISVMNCELLPKSDSGILSCELLVECRVRAQLEDTLSIATDVYSTEYDTEFTSNMLKISSEPRTLSQNFTVHSSIATDKGEIRSVWDAASELKNAVCRPDENGLMLSGQLCIAVYGSNTDGVPFFCEKQEPFEQAIAAENITPDTQVDFCANVIDTGFSIKPDGNLEITSTVALDASLHTSRTIEAVDTVIIKEDSPKPKSDEFALRICYPNEKGEKGEKTDCWSIAKKYNTTVAAIMEENDISDCDEPIDGGVIIIPTA